MTKNNAKVVLFASLLVTMILPFSMMDVSGATVEKTSERSATIKGKLFIKDSRDIVTPLHKEMSQLSEVVKDEKSSQSDKNNASTRMQEIRDLLTPKLMSNEKRDTIRGQIDSTATSIEEIERLGVPIVLIGTDHENQALRIGVERTGLTADKIYAVEEKIRTVIGNNIDLTIELSDES